MEWSLSLEIDGPHAAHVFTVLARSKEVYGLPYEAIFSVPHAWVGTWDLQHGGGAAPAARMVRS